MTARYNIFQILGAALCVLGGIFCFGLAYLFFLYLPSHAASQFGFPLTRTTANLIAAACLLVLAFSGYRRWRSGGGLYGYHESALYHDLGEETAGACVVDYYVHRVTGPAYAIGQLFLAGPLLLLRARTMVAGLLPSSPQLEERLAAALEVLRSANKWQALEDYPSMRTEILYLAQMGKIDFGSHRGKCRMKASVSHGV